MASEPREAFKNQNTGIGVNPSNTSPRNINVRPPDIPGTNFDFDSVPDRVGGKIKSGRRARLSSGDAIIRDAKNWDGRGVSWEIYPSLNITGGIIGSTGDERQGDTLSSGQISTGEDPRYFQGYVIVENTDDQGSFVVGGTRLGPGERTIVGNRDRSGQRQYRDPWNRDNLGRDFFDLQFDEFFKDPQDRFLDPDFNNRRNNQQQQQEQEKLPGIPTTGFLKPLGFFEDKRKQPGRDTGISLTEIFNPSTAEDVFTSGIKSGEEALDVFSDTLTKTFKDDFKALGEYSEDLTKDVKEEVSPTYGFTLGERRKKAAKLEKNIYKEAEKGDPLANLFVGGEGLAQISQDVAKGIKETLPLENVEVPLAAVSPGSAIASGDLDKTVGEAEQEFVNALSQQLGFGKVKQEKDTLGETAETLISEPVKDIGIVGGILAQTPEAVSGIAERNLKGKGNIGKTAERVAEGSITGGVGIASQFAKNPIEATAFATGSSLSIGKAKLPETKTVEVETGKVKAAEGIETEAPKTKQTTQTIETYRGIALRNPLTGKPSPVVGLKGKKPVAGSPEIETGPQGTYQPGNKLETSIFETNIKRKFGKDVYDQTVGAKKDIDKLGKQGRIDRLSRKIREKTGTQKTTRSISETLEQSDKFRSEEIPDVVDLLRQEDAKVFGSVAQATQLETARTPGDIDVAVKNKQEFKSKAQDIVGKERAESLFDIKELDENKGLKEGNVFSFGQKSKRGLTTEEGVRVQDIGEQLQRKTSGSIFLRGRQIQQEASEFIKPTGERAIGPQHPGRFKDPFDVRLVTEEIIKQRQDTINPFKQRRISKARKGLERLGEQYEFERLYEAYGDKIFGEKPDTPPGTIDILDVRAKEDLQALADGLGLRTNIETRPKQETKTKQRTGTKDEVDPFEELESELSTTKTTSDLESRLLGESRKSRVSDTPESDVPSSIFGSIFPDSETPRSDTPTKPPSKPPSQPPYTPPESDVPPSIPPYTPPQPPSIPPETPPPPPYTPPYTPPEPPDIPTLIPSPNPNPNPGPSPDPIPRPDLEPDKEKEKEKKETELITIDALFSSGIQDVTQKQLEEITFGAFELGKPQEKQDREKIGDEADVVLGGSTKTDSKNQKDREDPFELDLTG